MCRFLPVLPTLSIRREWLLRSRRSYSFDRHLSSLFNSFLSSFHSTHVFFLLQIFPISRFVCFPTFLTHFAYFSPTRQAFSAWLCVPFWKKILGLPRVNVMFSRWRGRGWGEGGIHFRDACAASRSGENARGDRTHSGALCKRPRRDLPRSLPAQSNVRSLP